VRQDRLIRRVPLQQRWNLYNASAQHIFAPQHFAAAAAPAALDVE
jgi:hypothetical protein